MSSLVGVGSKTDSVFGVADVFSPGGLCDDDFGTGDPAERKVGDANTDESCSFAFRFCTQTRKTAAIMTDKMSRLPVRNSPNSLRIADRFLAKK
jgi:hypothetical protein